MCSIDIHKGAVVKSRVYLGRGFGLSLGRGSTLGANCTLDQNVTIKNNVLMDQMLVFITNDQTSSVWTYQSLNKVEACKTCCHMRQCVDRG